MSVTRGTDSNVCVNLLWLEAFFSFFAGDLLWGIFLNGPSHWDYSALYPPFCLSTAIIVLKEKREEYPTDILRYPGLFFPCSLSMAWLDFFLFFFFFAGAGVGRGYVEERHNPVEETEQESQNFLTMNDLPLGLDVLLSAPRVVALHPRTLRSLGLHFPESSFHGVS